MSVTHYSNGLPVHYYEARFYFRLPSGQYVQSEPVPTRGELSAAVKVIRELGWEYDFTEYEGAPPTAEQLKLDLDVFIGGHTPSLTMTAHDVAVVLA